MSAFYVDFLLALWWKHHQVHSRLSSRLSVKRFFWKRMITVLLICWIRNWSS